MRLPITLPVLVALIELLTLVSASINQHTGGSGTATLKGRAADSYATRQYKYGQQNKRWTMPNLKARGMGQCPAIPLPSGIGCKYGNCAKCDGLHCTDTNTDINNCGKCGAKCSGSVSKSPNGVACSSGQCVPNGCSPPYTLCNNQCIKCESMDHCGACGQACTTASVPGSLTVDCSGGTCKATSCQANYMACDGKCIDTSSDPSNCGSCGHSCSASDDSCQGGSSFTCSAGKCTSISCGQGYVRVHQPGGGYVCVPFQTNQCGSGGSGCQGSNHCCSQESDGKEPKCASSSECENHFQKTCS